MDSSLKAFVNVTLSFLPLILLWSISDEYALVLGIGAVIILLIKEIINKNIGIMSRVLLGYFIVSNIFYFYLNINAILQYKYLSSYMVLALTGFISCSFGKPYTMYEARSGYEKEFWNSPLFIEVNILITKIWATIYLINVIIELTGHSIMKVAIMNVFVVIGTVISIMVPGLMPEN
ncbi:hypothetical protein [Clostridium sp. C2-6-12]|uniref:hypothetical protein n=1 Tax=Clostridium sp. C2-6-12 TaxID=2698832 RepID=UPI00137084DC|nr:hypothetical protein [Clostridium sp. C2-6-12]